MQTRQPLASQSNYSQSQPFRVILAIRTCPSLCCMFWRHMTAAFPEQTQVQTVIMKWPSPSASRQTGASEQWDLLQKHDPRKQVKWGSSHVAQLTRPPRRYQVGPPLVPACVCKGTGTGCIPLGEKSIRVPDKTCILLTWDKINSSVSRQDTGLSVDYKNHYFNIVRTQCIKTVGFLEQNGTNGTEA